MRPARRTAVSTTTTATTYPTLQNLGSQLREQRIAQARTAADLAGAAGLRTATLKQIEAGTVDPRLSQLQAIADALNVYVAAAAVVRWAITAPPAGAESAYDKH